MPGPSRVTPFLGGLIEMVLDPYSFWERQKDAANVTSPGYSYNSLAGKMILTVTDADKCRELMAVNDASRMLMVLHPSGKTILGANNLAFMHGPEHKAIRKSFLCLFTRKALSTYTQLQVRAGGGVGRWGRQRLVSAGQCHACMRCCCPQLPCPAGGLLTGWLAG